MGARAFPEPEGDGFWIDAAPVSRPLQPPLGLPAHPARAEVASPAPTAPGAAWADGPVILIFFFTALATIVTSSSHWLQL